MAAEFLAERPAMAARETQSLRQSRPCDSFPAIYSSNAIHVALGKPRDSRDVISCANLGSIPAKVLDNISSIPEVIHNVAEIARVFESQRVAEFVHTR